MAKILIIGNSAAGFSCAQNLAKNLLNHEITVISQDAYPAYKRDLLIDYLKGSVGEHELFLENQGSSKNITLILNSKVTSVDPKKKRVILKDNSKINFDYLVIASGQEQSIPDIPGKTKDGIFTTSNMEDIKTIKERMITTGTICIIGDTALCLRLWEALSLKEAKEIKIISSAKPDSFVASQNSEWLQDLKIIEFIGEGSELKAIKLNNGKIIGASLVLFAGNYSPATQFLKDSGVQVENGYITVNELMQTNFENIFACGSVVKNTNLTEMDKEKTWDQATREGALAAENIITLLGKENISCQQNSWSS